MQIKGIIFDLDGTLVDSINDIADAMNAMLAKYNFPLFEVDEYKFLVGNGIMKLVFNALPECERNNAMVQLCYREMMSIYRTNFLNKSTLYTGIPEMLYQLKSQNIKLAILSNKADEFVGKIKEVLLPDWDFERILGLTSETEKKPNPKNALEIAQHMGLHPSEIAFVGDSSVDMQTGVNAGMIPIGVTWGFRKRDELEKNGAHFIIDEPKQLLGFID